MPYIPIDMDAKKTWPTIAQGLGVDVAVVAHGFIEMWGLVWSARVDVMSTLQLECLFRAGGERVAAVLEAFGFLERLEDGHRVRGAAQWLGVQNAMAAGRSEGGKRARGNLVQYRAKPPAPPPADSRLPAGSTTGSTPAPFTQSPIPPFPQKEEEEKAATPPALGPEDLQQIWNDNIPSELPRCRELGKHRRSAAKQRLKEKPEPPYWRDVITRIATSDFCRGWNDRGWRADFDFLVRPDTAARVLEGKYDNRAGKARGPPGEATDAELRASMANHPRDENGDLLL